MSCLALVGCGGGSSEGGEGESDGSEWHVDYSGDLSGRIEGTTLVITKAGPPDSLTFAVKSLSSTPGLSASLSLHDGESFGYLLGLTLEDGTKCTQGDESTVEILDPDTETFHATLEGTAECGEAEDQIIDFQALIRER